LEKRLGTGFTDFENYFEADVEFSDNIHGIIHDFDLEEYNKNFGEANTFSEMIAKDFCAIYDDVEKKVNYYSIKGVKKIDDQNYNTISYEFEKDIFFSKSIKELFRPKSEARIERAFGPND